MKQRFTTLILLLISVMMPVFSQTTVPTFKLFATKVELNGEVRLVWTRPAGIPEGVNYELYRAKVADSASFTLIRTTHDTTYVDKVPSIITALSNSYAYYVLVNNNGTIEKSNTIVLPVPGIPPIGSFHLDGEVEDGKVFLEWKTPPVNTPVSYYLVYRGRLGDLLPIRFQIDSTTELHSITDIPQGVPVDGSVTFVYYVKAVFASGDPLVSTTAQITIENRGTRDELKFISRPPILGQVNIPFVYTAQAVSSDSTAIIRYFGRAKLGMLTVETGFKIDSVSGVVDWTPFMKGWYEVEIYAVTNKGAKAKQEFYVAVAEGNGIVQGKVIDEANNPIPKIVVQMFKTENNTNLSFAYSAVTDQNGNYRINRVDKGQYKVRATSPSGKYDNQWYNGVTEVQNATVVTITDSNSINPAPTFVPFKLHSGPQDLPKVMVSGFVTDTSGVALAQDSGRVVFVRADFALNFGGGLQIGAENFRKYFDFNLFNDFRLEGNSEHVFKARTDSLGHYDIQLVPGAYIAFAKARGYGVEFFNEQSSLVSANILIVRQDTSGINFTLAPIPPVVLGEIKGSVMDSSLNIGVPSRVIAFRDGWRFKDDFHSAKAYVVDTDSLGAYVIPDILPGTYIVLAVPLGSYVPAFYSADTSNHNWKHATKIHVSGNSVDNIIIYVNPISLFANGFASVSGKVTVNGMGSIMMNMKERAGVTVYALRNGQVAGYGFTNAEGNYSINGLTPGSYSVFVDKPGFNETSSANVSVAYNLSNPVNATNVNFTIDSPTSVAVGQSTVMPTNYALDQNFPNPFNPSTTISYSLPQSGAVTLKVYNIVGQEVATLINGFQNAGRYAVNFNAANFSSGVYFYRLQAGVFNTVKKMMLIK